MSREQEIKMKNGVIIKTFTGASLRVYDTENIDNMVLMSETFLQAFCRLPPLKQNKIKFLVFDMIYGCK